MEETEMSTTPSVLTKEETATDQSQESSRDDDDLYQVWGNGGGWL